MARVELGVLEQAPPIRAGYCRGGAHPSLPDSPPAGFAAPKKARR